jgi:malto-oligosyltrehalose trehalohydrolase
MSTRIHPMPFGAECTPAGVRFRIWAPSIEHMRVTLDGSAEPIALTPADAGWHECVAAGAAAGTRYAFVLPDGTTVPDPASRFQPSDVHGPSEVIDPTAYRWSDEAWAGRPWHEAVVYELHVGAFTPEGTFAAACAKLEHLRALGVTAIEVMPIADFTGRRNWGYDGVLPFAPDSNYGRPDDVKRFIEAAHALGLMVLLDVVYNHFGPDGNFLPQYAAEFFTARHKTPWGDGINYDGPQSGPVRAFAIENALYWLSEYQLDGLRLDAVHAIVDDRPLHVIDELAERVRAVDFGRPIHLIVENEANAARRLVRSVDGATPRFTAQWNDDVHHVLHAAVTGEDIGYYADYLGDTQKLGRALAEGFAFQGEVMPFKGGPRGEPSAALPPAAFVAFLQNHDQIGNRAFGDRITANAAPAAVLAASAVVMLMPQIPMVFMGEEWAAEQPFPFFCDFSGDLAAAVSKGRREEFARFPAFADPDIREQIPDPEADATFASAKLDWSALQRAPHAERLAWYQRILAVRATVIVPLVPLLPHGGTFEQLGPDAVAVHWTAENGVTLQLVANLSSATLRDVAFPDGLVFWTEGDAAEGVLGPWSVRWSLLKPL